MDFCPATCEVYQVYPRFDLVTFWISGNNFRKKQPSGTTPYGYGKPDSRLPISIFKTQDSRLQILDSCILDSRLKTPDSNIQYSRLKTQDSRFLYLPSR